MVVFIGGQPQEYIYSATAEANSRNITPLNHGNVGDLMVVLAGSYKESGLTTDVNTPAGWTLIAGDQFEYESGRIDAFCKHYKVLEATDNSSVSFLTSTSATEFAWIMFTFSGSSVPGASLIEANYDFTGTATHIKTINAESKPLIVFAGYLKGATSGDSSISTDTFTPTEDQLEQVSYSSVLGSKRLNMAFRYKIYNESPLNTTMEFDKEDNFSCMITCIVKEV